MLKKNKTARVKTKELQPAEYEKLGRMMQQVYETAYADRKRLLYLSFLQAVVRGLGTVIGATIVVGLVVWILTIIGEVSFLEPFVNDAKQTINQE